LPIGHQGSGIGPPNRSVAGGRGRIAPGALRPGGLGRRVGDRSGGAQAAAEFQIEHEIGNLPVERLTLAPQRGEPGYDLGFR
jgi:hypothetical protein